MSVPSTASVVRHAASARTIARLAQAFFTWEQEKLSFVCHLLQMEAGQDQTFWDCMEFLHAVAKDVDDSYRHWLDLERDFGKDYTNVRAHIELAIGHATVL